jgi:ribosome-associated protein
MQNLISYRQTPYFLDIKALRPIENAQQLKDSVLEILEERRAINVEIFENHPLAKYIIIAEHLVEQTLRTTASHISYLIKKASNYSANCEGMKHGGWVVLDLEDIIIHLFTEEARAQYSINELLERNAEKYQPNRGI